MDHTLRFSHLPYGKMQLHIKAQAADGAWGANQLDFTLNVVPPFYLRPWFIVMITIVVCSLAAGLYSWRLLIYKQENRRLDSVVKQKTEDLRNSLMQKEVLLSEVHHRVKNNLQMITSLLHLQSSHMTNPEAISALRESQARIMNMALVHQKLYQHEKLDSVDIRSFMDDIFNHIRSVYQSEVVEASLDNQFAERYILLDKIISLGLILNELITNSFKYAIQADVQLVIKVCMYEEQGFIIITYGDNGPGLPVGFQFDKAQTLGLHLIRRLSKQLGGSASYTFDNGAHFLIRFEI